MLIGFRQGRVDKWFQCGVGLLVCHFSSSPSVPKAITNHHYCLSNLNVQALVISLHYATTLQTFLQQCDNFLISTVLSGHVECDFYLLVFIF